MQPTRLERPQQFLVSFLNQKNQGFSNALQLLDQRNPDEYKNGINNNSVLILTILGSEIKLTGSRQNHHDLLSRFQNGQPIKLHRGNLAENRRMPQIKDEVVVNKTETLDEAAFNKLLDEVHGFFLASFPKEEQEGKTKERKDVAHPRFQGRETAIADQKRPMGKQQSREPLSTPDASISPSKSFERKREKRREEDKIKREQINDEILSKEIRTEDVKKGERKKDNLRPETRR